MRLVDLQNALSLKSLRRGLWLSFGIVAVFLGALGVFLPVLPTAPFAILAAFCFGKSSPVLQRKLENSAMFGPLIKDWKDNGAIRPRYKVIAVAMMGMSLILSALLSVPPFAFVFQLVCIIGAAGFVLTRPNGKTRSP